jgi:hypothetical protein
VAGHNRLCHLLNVQVAYRQDGIGVQIPKYCLGVLFWTTDGVESPEPWLYGLLAGKLTSRLQQTQLTATRNRFGAPLDLQLLKDISIVPFDGTQGEEKPLADLTIRESLGHEL